VQPLLLAWTQLGRGQPDSPGDAPPAVESNRLRALNALHAGMIADVASRPREPSASPAWPWPTSRSSRRAPPCWPRACCTAPANRRTRSGCSTGSRRGGDSALVVAGPPARAGRVPRRGLADRRHGGRPTSRWPAPCAAKGSGDFVLVLAQLALRLRPGFAPALMLTADVLAEEKQEEQALAVLQRVPADDPLAPLASLRRAAILDKLDRPDEAVAALRRLAGRQPGPAAARGAPRRPPAAPKPLRGSGRRLRPSPRARRQAGVRDWPLFYSRAIARERAGDWPRAETDLLRALELSPDQPYVLNYLGYTWADQGRNLDRAKAMLLRATELRPQDGNIATAWAGRCSAWATCAAPSPGWRRRWSWSRAPPSSTTTWATPTGPPAAAGSAFQWRRALNLEPEPEDGPKIEAKLRDGLPAARPAPRSVDAPAGERSRRREGQPVPARDRAADDGYHLLDSLAVFGPAADSLEAAPAPALSLSVDGPFGAAAGRRGRQSGAARRTGPRGGGRRSGGAAPRSRLFQAPAGRVGHRRRLGRRGGGPAPPRPALGTGLRRDRLTGLSPPWAPTCRSASGPGRPRMGGRGAATLSPAPPCRRAACAGNPGVALGDAGGVFRARAAGAFSPPAA
jgi:tetratricopeptide (TPR) repeat protein